VHSPKRCAIVERVGVAPHELGHGAATVLGYDENVVALKMHAVGKLGEDVRMPARPLGHQDVRTSAAVFEGNERLSLVARGEHHRLDGARDLTRIRLDDVVLLPVGTLLAPHGSGVLSGRRCVAWRVLPRPLPVSPALLRAS
jgi:hypothetical protein